MITIVSREDYFGILETFTKEEIRLKYGKLVMREQIENSKE